MNSDVSVHDILLFDNIFWANMSMAMLLSCE